MLLIRLFDNELYVLINIRFRILFFREIITRVIFFFIFLIAHIAYKSLFLSRDIG